MPSLRLHLPSLKSSSPPLPSPPSWPRPPPSPPPPSPPPPPPPPSPPINQVCVSASPVPNSQSNQPAVVVVVVAVVFCTSTIQIGLSSHARPLKGSADFKFTFPMAVVFCTSTIQIGLSSHARPIKGSADFKFTFPLAILAQAVRPQTSIAFGAKAGSRDFRCLVTLGAQRSYSRAEVAVISLQSSQEKVSHFPPSSSIRLERNQAWQLIPCGS